MSLVSDQINPTLNDYARNAAIIKDDAENLTGDDVREGHRKA